MTAAHSIADARGIANELAQGRRIFRNGNGWKTFCPLCRPEAGRPLRPTLSVTVRGELPLFHCHRCKSPGLQIIRELVRRKLLPNRFRESSKVFAQLREILATIRLKKWNGRAHAANLIVLESLTHIAGRCCKLQFGASVRELADAAQISPGTASRALKRLEKAGWLERVKPAAGEQPVIWRLRVPRKTPDRTATIQPADREGDRLFQNDPFFIHGDRAEQYRPVTAFQHEAFRWGGGLGAIKGRIFAFLETPEAAHQIAVLMKYRHVRNARLHLQQLVYEGLIRRRSDGRYERSDDRLNEVAARRRVLGSNARQRHLHHEQRTRFRHWHRTLEHWRRTGELVDPDTGVVLDSRSRPIVAATLATFRREVLRGRSNIGARKEPKGEFAESSRPNG